MLLFNLLGKLFERTEFVLFWLLVVLVFLGLQYTYILTFLLVLFVLILVHEWGHFIVAKKTGMRVDEFGIGFPPKLFGWRRGETEYTLNALPIGGFVRILGENFDQDDDSLSNEDRARAFGTRPKWAQALVLIAGVAMNVIFAWFLFVVALMVGVPAAADPDNPSDEAVLSVINILPDSPAERSGIPVGATVLSLASESAELTSPTPTSFQEFVIANGHEELTIIYDSKGEQSEVVLQAESGVVTDEAERPAVGVSLAHTEIKREPLHRALVLGAESTVTSLVAITKGLSGLLIQTFRGTADFSQVAGPIGIAGLVGDAAEFGFTSLLLFTAMISLNLAVINLLPIPALDGGRLIFVGIEAITKRDIPPVWAMRVNFIGFAFLMLLMVAVTYGDIVKIL